MDGLLIHPTLMYTSSSHRKDYHAGPETTLYRGLKINKTKNHYLSLLILFLRAIPDSDIGVGTNCVIYKYTLISKIRHTSCPIDIHQSSMIINQTMIELFDIRYAQNYILDEDVM